MKEVGSFAIVILVAALAFVLAGGALLGGIGWVINHAGLPSQLAKIEQLRDDASDVDPTQAEDVIGQVTSWNQTIRSNQALNDTWYAGWVIPDEWDGVEPIVVPAREAIP